MLALRHQSAALSARHRAAGKVVLRLEALEDRTVPTLLGNSLFPGDTPWNQRITAAPVAANSGAILSNITTLYGDGRLHPDFGQDYRNGNDLYGIPYNVVHGNSTPKTHVVIDDYAGESDLQDVPLPANVVLEGDFQNGPRAGVDARGDSHLLVYDVDNNIGYEFYRASRPGENADGKWHAAQESVWDMKANTFRTLGWTSADAAGLAILPGLVRPDEALPAAQGGQGVINHAIRFTLQNSIILNKFLYPASHTANPGNTNAAVQPPMGARFRLKAGVDVSGLNPQSKVIAQAMKDYGMIVADNGSNFFFSGASYSVDASNGFALTFDDDDVQDTLRGLKSLHFSDFEVVDLTPAVTGLSAASGSAGATITVTGRNFSGAAGHLQVLFGSTPATNVTLIDDGHLTAVVPAGSGTVDVRVVSGVNAPGHSNNINDPTFGYGTSAVSPADRFTWGGGSNAPPTVATPASATPATVTGRTTALSVLGADDGGEANLTYTWAVLSGPAGASPTFSANGTNAAKNATATFDRAGSYTFRVTIRDAQGASVTSDATVTVVQTITTVQVSPATATVAPGGTLQLTASGYDQFGRVLTQQPTFSWVVVSGPGSVSGTGLYTTPSHGSGTAVVRASAGGVSGQATLRIRSRKDLAGRNQQTGQVVVATSTGTGFTTALAGTWNPAVNWVDVKSGDLNGDGYSDLIGRAQQSGQWWASLSNGASSFTTSQWGSWSPAVTWVDVQIGDVNGDGKDDLIGRVQQTGQWWAGTSNGSSLANSLWGNWSPAVTWVDVRSGDLNGDGKMDVIGRAQQSGQWWAGLSTGTSLSNALWGNWSGAVTWADVLLGDLNGDGKADLIGRVLSTGQWWAGISNGSALTNALWAAWSPAVTWADVRLGDLNGDGKMDLLGRVQQSGQWWAGLSTGTALNTSLWAAWSPAIIWADVALADLDGDGKDDLIGRALQSGDWWAGVSDGGKLMTALWDHWNPAVTWDAVRRGNFG